MANAYIKRENMKREFEGKPLLAQPKRRSRQGTKIDVFDDGKDPLSNNYRYMFTYKNVQFFTAAHAYYCAKAEMYHEGGYYREIKNAYPGLNVLYLGRKIRVDDRWEKVRVNIMRDILREKMKQCANYRKRLAECNGLIVAAFHDDNFWYSGAKKEAVLKNGEYPGQNMLGLLHTEIRNEMKDGGEFPEAAAASTLDNAATVPAAGVEDAPPAKRLKTDEATQAINELLATIYEKSESTETHHSDDDLNFGEPIPVVTTKAPMPPPPDAPITTQPLASNTMSPPSSAPIKTQPLAAKTSAPSTNQGKCIWCLTVQSLLPGKKFCAECSAQGVECAYCHRPMPERFFAYSQKLCNACYKKDAKQKAKRRMRTAQIRKQL